MFDRLHVVYQPRRLTVIGRRLTLVLFQDRRLSIRIFIRTSAAVEARHQSPTLASSIIRCSRQGSKTASLLPSQSDNQTGLTPASYVPARLSRDHPPLPSEPLFEVTSRYSTPQLDREHLIRYLCSCSCTIPPQRFTAECCSTPLHCGTFPTSSPGPGIWSIFDLMSTNMETDILDMASRLFDLHIDFSVLSLCILRTSSTQDLCATATSLI